MIHVEMLSGPGAGMRMAHDEPVLGFGRSAENAIALEDPHLSRRHGEVRLDEGGRWVVVGEGANGTQVNGRTIRNGKPRALRSGDVIGVGGATLFALHFQQRPAAAGPGPGAHEPPAGGLVGGTGGVGGVSAGAEAHPTAAGSSVGPGSLAPGLSGRAKLWIGLGGFNVVALGVILVSMMVGAEPPGPGEAPRLEAERITAEVRRPLDRPRDEREAARHLTEARERYPRTGGSPDGLYRAHRHYKLAEAYGGADALEGLDRLRLLELERELVGRLTSGSRDAYNLIRNREWAAAERRLRELAEAYPDSGSEVFRALQRQIMYVREHRPQPRTFR